jgi:hypothetical protein
MRLTIQGLTAQCVVNSPQRLPDRRKQAHTRAPPVPMHGHNPGLDPGVLRGRHAPIGATVTA